MSILDGVNFTAVPPPQETGDLPFVTHEGVLEVAGHKLRCYRLSDGKAIIHEEDFYSFFDELGEPAASEVRVEAVRGT